MDKIKRTTTKDRVVAELRKAILNGMLKPGQALVQEQIAEELNVSRMPVREAIKVLESDGLVTTTPFKGSVVSTITGEDLREIYDIRKVLEGYATVQTVSNITEEGINELKQLIVEMRQCIAVSDFKKYEEVDRAFHSLIADNSGNQRLAKMIKASWDNFAPYIVFSIPGRIQRSVEEHNRIANEIAARNPEGAYKACCEQIETVYKEISPYFERQEWSEITTKKPND